MFRFLNDCWERTGRPEQLGSLLSSLRTELFDDNDGRRADRPMWIDWLGSVEAVRGSTGRDTCAADTESPDSTYSTVRHASIAGRPASGWRLAWVVVTHWQFESGKEEWYTEYLDDGRNEEAPEELHASCDEAVALAEQQFGERSWMPGHPPH